MAGIRFARLKKIGQHIMEPSMNTGIRAQNKLSVVIVVSMYVKEMHITL